jgi:uncharacterized protein DUF4184
MPFTLAHPAAVLPLIRRPFVTSALVAGAVAPDLLYVDPLYRFATREIDGNLTLTLTHKFSSVLWLDPLLALMLLAVFNLVVRRPLLALAWSGLAARLPSPAESVRLPSVATFGWTALSAVVGAFTHVLWDSFTHYDGYFVRRFHGVFTAGVTASWDVNRVLQYISSVGGCLVLAIWLYRWYRRAESRSVSADRYVPARARYAVLAATALVGVAGAVVQLNRADGEIMGEDAARLALTGLASGCLAGLGWYVVIWHAVRLARLRRGVVRL